MKRSRQIPAAPASANDASRGLRRLLRACWKSYRARLRACLKDTCLESVHESRVAARRLQALLELLGALLHTEDTAKALRALKRHIDLLSPMRDVHELRAALPSLRLPRDPSARFDEHLARAEEKAAHRIHRRVGRLKTHRIARHLDALDDRLRRDRPPLAASQLAAEIRKRFARVVELRDRALGDGVEAIHRTRIAFKRYRYTAELILPLLPGANNPSASAMRRQQRLMGAVQDACVALEKFDRFASRSPRASDVRVQHKLAVRRDRAAARWLKHAGDLERLRPF